jgi:CspA family cold shock protein
LPSRSFALGAEAPFREPSDGSSDVFVHISALERAGRHDLREGQPIAYEVQKVRRTGKASATNLRLV